MTGQRIMVIDDELSMREVLTILLQRDGYEVESFATAEDAIDVLEGWWPALILTDMNLPGKSGLDLLREVKVLAAQMEREIDVVVITAFGSNDTAVEAMQNGAANYVLKPFKNEELRLVVRRSLGLQEMVMENVRLKKEVKERFHFANMVGSSSGMHTVFELVRRVKDTRISCLIVGESGTGKEMVARAIHFNGQRMSKPFVAINCGAIPENLVESELFGHKKGSFTGAYRDKDGLFASADGGTLFLDEVNALPLAAQVKLLRAIQEKRFTPVGGVQEVSVDVRVIAASNVDLEDAIREGLFREDLFYRMNVVQIAIPPLRERGADIPELTKHFLNQYSKEYDRTVVGLSPEATKVLMQWHFPGNVRELRNVIERAVALCPGSIIQAADLPTQLRNLDKTKQSLVPVTFPEEGFNLDAHLSKIEKRWLLSALEFSNGNKTLAAKNLKMSFRSFRYRLAKFGLADE